jgi:hypothetical protein
VARTPPLVWLSIDDNTSLEQARALMAAHPRAVLAVEPRGLVVGISHHVVGAELAWTARVRLSRIRAGFLSRRDK